MQVEREASVVTIDRIGGEMKHKRVPCVGGCGCDVPFVFVSGSEHGKCRKCRRKDKVREARKIAKARSEAKRAKREEQAKCTIARTM